MKIMKSAKEEKKEAMIKAAQASGQQVPKEVIRELIDNPEERTVLFFSQNVTTGEVTVVFPSARDAQPKRCTFDDWRYAFKFLTTELGDFMKTREKAENDMMAR